MHIHDTSTRTILIIILPQVIQDGEEMIVINGPATSSPPLAVLSAQLLQMGAADWEAGHERCHMNSNKSP